jgi:hypothetical protein
MPATPPLGIVWPRFAGREGLADTAAAKADKSSSDDAVPAWQLFALAGLVGATFVVFMSRGQSPAAIVLLSATIFAAAAVGIAALRMLSPFTGDVGLVRGPMGRMLAGRTRAALEREKALTLRSIKELEFDRAMGKVSDADFAEMAARLRAKAAGLIQRLDAGTTYRQQIDREIERRLGTTPAPPAAGVCAGCGTTNDPDARFCKQCGVNLART